MTIRRRVAVVMAAIGTLSAAGLVGASAASASSEPYTMCVIPSVGTGVNCAVASGVNVIMSNSAEDGWFVPQAAGVAGQIRLYNVQECMQQDNAASPNLELEACQGKAAEEWTSVADGNGTFSFVNKYTSGCLNDDVYTGYLDVAPCNYGTNEDFGLNPY
jgi:hypothetical protein